MCAVALSLIIISYLHIEVALHIACVRTDQQGRCGATLANDCFTDGKMQLWHGASMFLEDASSLDRGSTFSTICQGYSRWTKQWSSHSNADSGRGPSLGSGTQTVSLIQDLCLFKHTVLGPVGTVSRRTLWSDFHFCLYLSPMSFKKITGGMLGKLEMGIVGPQCPAMSQQHSFTYSMLCDHQRGALTSGLRDQTDSSEFYGNFSSAVSYPCFCCRHTQIFYPHSQLNNAVSGLWQTCLLQLTDNMIFRSDRLDEVTFFFLILKTR